MPRTRLAHATLPLLLAACATSAEPVAPSLELVDEGQRLAADLVNAHTYGTFAISFGSEAGVIRSGPANFPGNPPGGPGTCVDGHWYNSKGKSTAGTLDHPHPHCITSGSAMQVVLEPISSMIRALMEICEVGRPCDFLHLSDPRSLQVSVVQSFSKETGGLGTQGWGTVYAYAIDAATLGTTNTRVGTIKFTLDQYDASTNLFGTCSLDDGDVQCLPKVIDARYDPLAVGGVGTSTFVTGFLWWAPATAPYNY